MAIRAYEGKPGAGMSALEGQSGAGMVPLYISRPDPRRSHAARQIAWLRTLLADWMAQPVKSAQRDESLCELETLLRTLAGQYIAEASTDLDLLAFMARETACGRRHSQAAAARLFCQAGVVAPPDSPGFGKNGRIGVMA